MGWGIIRWGEGSSGGVGDLQVGWGTIRCDEEPSGGVRHHQASFSQRFRKPSLGVCLCQMFRVKADPLLGFQKWAVRSRNSGRGGKVGGEEELLRQGLM